MSELESLLNSVENANSKKTYNTTYNKLVSSGLFSNPISDTPNMTVIKNIKTITDNAFTRKTYLTAVIKMKRLANKGIIELENYREQQKVDILQHIRDKKETANPDGLTLKGFANFVDALYRDQRYKEYIVNYLFLHYGVRNQDIDCIIVNGAKKVVPAGDNSLLVYKTKVDYIRQKYKTFKTYGQKKITIKDKKFITAVNALNRGDGQPLLITPTGERFNPSSLNTIIQRMTYGEAGEGRLFKLLIDEYKFNDEKITALAESRGTKKKEIMAFYTNTDLTGNATEL